MTSIIINVKGKGRLSAESIVTVRASVTYYLEDEPEPTFFQVMITAPAADLELFLLPYIDNETSKETQLRTKTLAELENGIVN